MTPLMTSHRASFYPRPWAAGSVWAPPTGEPIVPTFALPAPVVVQQGDPVVRRARVSRPELVGVAAWWANMPASMRAKDAKWGANDAKNGWTLKPWDGEQEARMHAKDKVAEYVKLGYSEAWAKWYCGPLAEAHQARKAMTRKDEYALYVASAAGPALDKLAKKLSPARKRTA